jgi:hypothetical protein
MCVWGSGSAPGSVPGRFMCARYRETPQMPWQGVPGTYTQLRDCLTERFPRRRSCLRGFGAFKNLRKVDEFGGRSVRARFRRALSLRERRLVLSDNLLYLVLAAFAQGGELAIRRYYVAPLFGSY